MKNKLLLILLLCCNGIILNAQNNYNKSSRFLKANSNWIFGDKAGINFNVSPPAAITSSISGPGFEGSAAASDPVTGKLLFYSNGAKCWKANGQIMAHGDSLLGNNEGGLTATQGVCIVPFINDTSKYYLFSLSDYSNPNSLYYSVVDMSLDNGLGDIDPANKNILLNATSLSEAMVAIPGECNDIWLMVHSYRDPEFIAYHITAKGIDTTPVITRLGDPVTGGVLATYGRMAASPDRQKIAINGQYLTNHLTYIVKFDPATGTVSNRIDIKNVTSNEAGHGICFSPDNTKLYVVTVGIIIFAPNPYRLYQFDVSNYDSAAIAQSRYSVYETAEDMYSTRADLKLYNDTVYICVQATGGSVQDQIDRINSPNVSGAGCKYEKKALNPLSGTRFYNTFGSDVVYPMAVDTIYQHLSQTDTAFCTGSSVTLKAPPSYDNYLWSDGSAGSTIEVTEAGTYWASYRDSCYNLYIDTYVVKELSFTPPVVQADDLTLSTTTSYQTYQWLFNGNIIPGATDGAYTVTENGNYQVIVSNEFGCSDTSAVYPVNITSIGSVAGTAHSITLYPNPAKEQVWIKSPFPVNVQISTLSGRAIQEYKKVTSFHTKYLAPGMYFVTLSDEAGRTLKVEKLIKAGN